MTLLSYLLVLYNYGADVVALEQNTVTVSQKFLSAL